MTIAFPSSISSTIHDNDVCVYATDQILQLIKLIVYCDYLVNNDKMNTCFEIY